MTDRRLTDSSFPNACHLSETQHCSGWDYYHMSTTLEPTREYSKRIMSALTAERITHVEEAMRRAKGHGSGSEKGQLARRPATRLHVSGIGAVMFFGTPDVVLEQLGLPEELLTKTKPIRETRSSDNGNDFNLGA